MLIHEKQKEKNLKRETWTKLEGHHIYGESTRNFLKSPAQP
jgi:hypothetical protein